MIYQITLPPAFLEAIQGKFSAEMLVNYFLIHIYITITFLLLSYFTFSRKNKYSIMTHTISFLGSWIEERNPSGWWIFTIGMMITSLMWIPIHIFIFSKMVIVNSPLAWFCLILGIYSSVMLFFIAIFPDNEDLPLTKNKSWGQVHDFFAMNAIFGMLIDIVLYGVLIIILQIRTDIDVYINPFINIAYIFCIFIISVGIYYQIKWGQYCKKHPEVEVFPGEGIYSFPLWEWILFVLLFFIMYTISFSFLPF